MEVHAGSILKPAATSVNNRKMEPMDSMDSQIEKEMQRSEMLELLREANSAVIICVHPVDGLVHAFMNLNPVERRGMAELMRDTAPKFYPAHDDDLETEED